MIGQWLIVVLLMVLSFIDNACASPMVLVINQWIRWGLISACFAIFLVNLELSDKSFWLLWVVGFMGWFLIETMYIWFKFWFLSKSDALLFPLFRENPRSDEWPNRSQYIQMREELRACGFRDRQSLKAELSQGLEARSTIFENEDTQVQLQVLFIHRGNQLFLKYFIFNSYAESGHYYCTDNVRVPFGGYYPENWHVLRRPLVSSWKKLLALHSERISVCQEEFKLLEEEPVVDINNRQRMLERLNIDCGILFPSTMHEEHGLITWEGRYRLCKEAWLQKYLGVNLSHKFVTL